MKRRLLALFVPPFAVCHYGCAGRCAAPIGVFWITGIVSIIYAFFGGPAQLDRISLGTLGLGITLWGIAVIWAENTIRGVETDNLDPKCGRNLSTVCRIVRPGADDSDPMDEAKKFQS